jgi:hypothetical protein
LLPVKKKRNKKAHVSCQNVIVIDGYSFSKNKIECENQNWCDQKHMHKRNVNGFWNFETNKTLLTRARDAVVEVVLLALLLLFSFSHVTSWKKLTHKTKQTQTTQIISGNPLSHTQSFPPQRKPSRAQQNSHTNKQQTNFQFAKFGCNGKISQNIAGPTWAKASDQSTSTRWGSLLYLLKRKDISCLYLPLVFSKLIQFPVLNRAQIGFDSPCYQC